MDWENLLNSLASYKDNLDEFVKLTFVRSEDVQDAGGFKLAIVTNKSKYSSGTIGFEFPHERLEKPMNIIGTIRLYIS